MIKIFIASSPEKPNNNLAYFYPKLISDNSIEVSHPSSADDVDNIESKETKVLEYELAKIDRLKILESDIIILDWDSSIKIAYLYWSCVNPNTKVIVVSRLFPNIDLFAGENVVAVVKPEFAINLVYSLQSQVVASQGKQDPTHD